jgi:predicted metal-binding membrane protein
MNSMDMAGMDMPGGWTLSMMWMRMPGQTWTGLATAFMSMWIIMMTAMMLPVLVPSLWRYRCAVGAASALPRPAASAASLTAWVAIGYFAVWAAAGLLIFPLGAACASAVLATPALSKLVPFASGLILIAAGGLQLTVWKSRQLACCRQSPPRDGVTPATAPGAVRHGLQLGVRCTLCCAPLTVMLLVLGLMDLRAMLAITAAVTLERLCSAPRRTAHFIGALAIAGGVLRLV